VAADPSDALFQYALGFVMAADVAAFAPVDPGYWNYVRKFEEILETRRVPERDAFDISETVGLTRWADAEGYGDPQRFRRFRVLLSSVGLSMLVRGRDERDAYPANYMLIRLIDDGFLLGDAVLLRMLPAAFEQAHEACGRECREERGFATLGMMLVGATLGMGNEEMEALAERLMEEEKAVEYPQGSDFCSAARITIRFGGFGRGMCGGGCGR
jgi:hypothetical protein